MSFRFVGTALSILGTSGASGYYLAGPMASNTRPPTIVVPVSQSVPMPKQAVRRGNDPASVALAVLAPKQVVRNGNDPASVALAVLAPTGSADGYASTQATLPPAALQAGQSQPYGVANGSYWQPRIWVGVGAVANPLTGWPLTREEAESGWVDAPLTQARNDIAEAPAAAAPRPMVAEAWVTAPAGLQLQYASSAAPPAADAAGLPHDDQVEERHTVRPQAPAHAAPPRGTPVATAPAAMASAAMASARTSEGGYRIHLASYRNSHDTDREWAKLRASQPGIFAPLSLSTTTVTLPGKGVFVRLLAGPFESKADAERTCADLRRGHQYCQPLPPSS